MSLERKPLHDVSPDRPVLLVVDADEAARSTFVAALQRRYGADYRVISAGSATDGLAVLEQLAREESAVALVAAALHLPEMDGVAVLDRASALHRGAGRVLLVPMDPRGTRIPFNNLPALQQAMALGRIDVWIVKGSASPEEWLYPQIQEMLTAWTAARGTPHEVFRVVGERWSPQSHKLRDMLTRNTIPYGFYAADSDEGRRLIREHGVDTARLPAIVRFDGSVVHQPTDIDVAESLGVETRPASEVYDLAILGAGPAGLAAAVYGSSEGLRAVVIEGQAIGGQAGTSSMIRNYLGFPRGVGGGPLAFRAWEQALLFGTQFVFTQQAMNLEARGIERTITLSGNTNVTARAVIIAIGVTYRRLGIPALDRLVGVGVYYGAAGAEAQAMTGEQVFVIGGANSAGQAALHLAKYAARVTLLVRGKSLAASMSDYLIRQVMSTPNIDVRLQTQVIDGRGEHRLDSLVLEHVETGAREEVRASALFVLIGAEPRTEWLLNAVAIDDRGFVLTGGDIPADSWPLARAPLPFETSMPGVFAVGDVRHGSVKRVAGAVGEGSVAVGSVHQYLVDPAGSGLAEPSSAS